DGAAGASRPAGVGDVPARAPRRGGSRFGAAARARRAVSLTPMHHHHHEIGDALRSWDVNHVVVWLLPIAAFLYARGFLRVHRQLPQRYPARRLVSFLGGIAVVFLAIASPLHALGELVLSLHMAQHMLLTMLAPPLLWLGPPLIPLPRRPPPHLARRILGPALTSPSCHRLGRAITH